MATYNFKFDGGVYRVDGNAMLTALKDHKRANETLCGGLKAMLRIVPPAAFGQDADLTPTWYSTDAQKLVDHFLAMPGVKHRDGTYKPWFSYRQQPTKDVVAAFASHGLRVDGANNIVPIAKPRPVKASTKPTTAPKTAKGKGKPSPAPATPAPAIPDYRPNRDVALIGSNGNGSNG